jgi:hypothetical protein
VLGCFDKEFVGAGCYGALVVRNKASKPGMWSLSLLACSLVGSGYGPSSGL